jgi:hypothetical protein
VADTKLLLLLLPREINNVDNNHNVCCTCLFVELYYVYALRTKGDRRSERGSESRQFPEVQSANQNQNQFCISGILDGSRLRDQPDILPAAGAVCATLDFSQKHTCSKYVPCV